MHNFNMHSVEDKEKLIHEAVSTKLQLIPSKGTDLRLHRGVGVEAFWMELGHIPCERG